MSSSIAERVRALAPSWLSRRPATRALLDLDGFTVEVVADRHAASSVDALAALFPRSSSAPESVPVVSVWRTRGPEFEVQGFGEPIAVPAAALLLLELIPQLCRLGLDHSPATLHLHVGAVRRADRAIIVSGESGAGKSTLTAWLGATWGSIVTDEMVSARASGLITGLRRPMMLRVPTTAPVDALAARHDLVVTSIPGHVVLGSATPADPTPARVSVIAFNRWRSDADEVTVVPITRAEAAQKLLANSFDAVRLGADAVTVASEMARSAACVRISYADAAAASAALVAVDASGAPSASGGPPLLTLGPSPVVEGSLRDGGVPALQPGTRAVVFDDSVLVHVDGERMLLEADLASAPWWEKAIAEGVLPTDTAPEAVAGLEESGLLGHLGRRSGPPA